MLIHRQNSYAPRSKQRTGRREAHSRKPANKVKKLPVLCHYQVKVKGKVIAGLNSLSTTP
jgi:hypothetical protein